MLECRGPTAESIFSLLPVQRRRRCDRCERAVVVDFDGAFLCGDCFLEESKRRFTLQCKPLVCV